MELALMMKAACPYILTSVKAWRIRKLMTMSEGSS